MGRQKNVAHFVQSPCDVGVRTFEHSSYYRNIIMPENFVTIAHHTRQQLMYMLRWPLNLKNSRTAECWKARWWQLCFSNHQRTRLSFETAANRLGARVIGFTDPKVTSSSKGETLKDTIIMVSNYADVIIMRHYLEGAAQYASEVTDIPIINAGDGANQHPSQTMLDLYSIYKTSGYA